MIVALFILIAGIVYVIYRLISDGDFNSSVSLKPQNDPVSIASGWSDRQHKLIENKDELSDLVGWPVGSSQSTILALRLVAEQEGWTYESINLNHIKPNEIVENLSPRAAHELSDAFRAWVERYPSKDKNRVLHSRIGPCEYVVYFIDQYHKGETNWAKDVTRKLYPWRLNCFPNKVGVNPNDFETEAEYETEIARRTAQ